jgi:hypothetical protein
VRQTLDDTGVPVYASGLSYTPFGGNYSPEPDSGSGKAGVPSSACTAANAVVPRCLAVSITEHNAA